MKTFKTLTVLLLSISAFAGSTAHAIDAPVTDDSYVRENAPTANFGSRQVLLIGTQAERQSFIRFDVAGLEGMVDAAALKLRVRSVVTPGILEVRRVLGPWDESTITFNTAPGLGPVEQSLAIGPGDVGAMISLDVGAMVQAWVDNPVNNYGLALTAAGGLTMKAESSDGAAAGPQLAVDINFDLNVYTNMGTMSFANQQWVSTTLGCNGGDLAVSGGYQLSVAPNTPANLWPFYRVIDFRAENATTWRFTFKNDSDEPLTLRIYTRCLDVTP